MVTVEVYTYHGELIYTYNLPSDEATDLVVEARALGYHTLVFFPRVDRD
jgi:hypothetical protein